MTTRWLLFTDSVTNEILARELTRAGITEEATTEVLYRGKKIPVWEVPHRFVNQLQKSRRAFPVAFTVLVQENGGAVRRWNLQGRGKLARQKPVRAMKRKIARRKN